MKILLKNGRIFSGGSFINADAAIKDGVITAVGQTVSPDGFDRVFDCENMLILPGLVDVHVHLRQPGFSYKETIKTGTAAAAHGGYTDVYTMPNLDPVPDSAEHMKEQLDIIERDACIRVHPYASITAGEKGACLSDMEELAPFAAGFSDDGKGVQSSEMMRMAMERAAKLGKPIVAHCENESLLEGGYINKGSYAMEHGHRGICSESEWEPIKRDIGLVRQTGCRYHVCHVSAKESVELIRVAKAEGLPVTCETAPHYLTLCDRDIDESDIYGDKGGRFKMNPPMRSETDRAELIRGILDGTIDVIATDHAPHAWEEKNKGLEKSLMGVVGLETAFHVLYTRLVRKENIISPEKLVRLMAVAPRKLFDPSFDENSLLTAGSPADLTIIRPLDSPEKVDPDTFLSKGRSTPFSGWDVLSRTELTLCGGRVVWQSDTIHLI